MNTNKHQPGARTRSQGEYTIRATVLQQDSALATKSSGASELAGLTVEVTSYDGIGRGIRRVDAVGSQVVLHAGPIGQTAEIAQLADLGGRTVAYVLLADNGWAYVGKGSADFRLVHQTGKCGTGQRFSARQLFVLHARDPRGDDIIAKYVEGKLVERGFAVAAPLINRVVPQAPDISGCSLIELPRLAEEALLFLALAGCPVFERSARRGHDASLPPRDGYRIIRGTFSPPADAPLLQFRGRNYTLQGYRVGDHLIVPPGSPFRASKGTVREADQRRRAAILADNILRRDPNRTDWKILCAWIEFKDPTIAVRVISGIHKPKGKWTPVEEANTGANREDSNVS